METRWKLQLQILGYFLVYPLFQQKTRRELFACNISSSASRKCSPYKETRSDVYFLYVVVIIFTSRCAKQKVCCLIIMIHMHLLIFLFTIFHLYIRHIFLLDCGSTVVKVLRYKSEGRWFNPRCCHGIFHWHKSFWSHYGPGVDSASNRNEYQEYFLVVNAAGA
jgi:hypothetical protein